MLSLASRTASYSARTSLVKIARMDQTAKHKSLAADAFSELFERLQNVDGQNYRSFNYDDYKTNSYARVTLSNAK